MGHKIGKAYRGPQPKDVAAAASEQPPEVCECGGLLFIEASRVKVIPMIRVGAPADVIYQEHVLACVKCWKPLTFKKAGLQ